MSESNFGRKEIIGTLGAGAGILAFPQAVTTAVHTAAGGVNAAMELGVEALATAANSIGAGFIGTAAPFIAPAIAGGYAGKTLADLLKIENETVRRVFKWGGVGLGAAASLSPIAPYLVGGAVATAIGKKPLKWALSGIGSLAGGLYGAAVGAPISAVKGFVKGGINNAKHPQIIPQT